MVKVNEVRARDISETPVRFWYQYVTDREGLYVLCTYGSYHTVYVVKVIYTAWSNSNHTRISASIPLLTLIWDKRNAVNHFFVKSWGSERNLLPTMILIDNTFISLYKIREKLL